MNPHLSDSTKDKIAELCRKYKILELSLFGSRARGDFTEGSDFDFLVEFSPTADISLFEFSRIQLDLEEVVQANVDLVPKEGLKPLIRDEVLAEAKIVYEA